MRRGADFPGATAQGRHLLLHLRTNGRPGCRHVAREFEAEARTGACINLSPCVRSTPYRHRTWVPPRSPPAPTDRCTRPVCWVPACRRTCRYMSFAVIHTTGRGWAAASVPYHYVPTVLGRKGVCMCALCTSRGTEHSAYIVYSRGCPHMGFALHISGGCIATACLTVSVPVSLRQVCTCTPYTHALVHACVRTPAERNSFYFIASVVIQRGRQIPGERGTARASVYMYIGTEYFPASRGRLHG